MKGYIYILRSNLTPKVYYGCTTQNLHKRLSHHLDDYNRYCKGTTHYKTSYELIDYPDARIELVEEVEYEHKHELYEREKYYIMNNECVNRIKKKEQE
jgi:predicted GIY-YIG superfamily endonuclease